MKSIASKMSEVGAAIGFGIPKDGHNASQNYDFTSAANVRMSVGPELARRKIAVSSAVTVVSQDHPVSKSGAAQHRVVILVTMTFVDGESGEMMTAQALGSGVDAGDKACAKAMTMAEKYCYVSAFTLAMGEDPERDEPEKPKRDDRLDASGHARAEQQAAAFDDHVLTAKAMVDEFTSATCKSDVLTWAKLHGASFQTLPSKPKDLRTRAWTAIVKHLDKIEDIGITANELRAEITRISKEG